MFPTAVEDAADAVLYLHSHATQFGLDTDRIALCGFSAGGNIAFTAPLLVQDTLLRARNAHAQPGETPRTEAAQSAPIVLPHEHALIKLILAFYPTTDYTRTRAVRRASIPAPGRSKALPHMLTQLFDASYMHPPQSIRLDSPFLSPGLASDELLALLPENVVMFTCEWDEVREEGEAFRERLRALGKDVSGGMVKGVRHAWDKAPSWSGMDESVTKVYDEACEEIKRVFGEATGSH